ncbi:MAG: F0F1 ATP synthase subunit A [Lachnospiraceae bacterium]|nr:F0F1 ATP synthase subunit A [Lachnospiraceae bacterium]
MGNTFLLSSGTEIDFMIHGIFSYKVFDQTVWITTTHVCLVIVLLMMITFCLFARRAMKKATEVPSGFQNVLELIVESLDGIVNGTMDRFAPSFRNYIGTVFIFIWLCNTSGLFGLRPPTADFATTFGLAMITFLLVNVSEFKYHKIKGYVKHLFEPMPFFLPLNLIGKISYPISLSLRLFANNLSGVIMLSMVYVLLKSFAYVWPSFLHAFFDFFVGTLQTYVFCVLSMTYIKNACVGE